MPIPCGDGTGMQPEFRNRWSILLTPEKSNEGEACSSRENKFVVAGTFKG
jgi:hypothetical protein